MTDPTGLKDADGNELFVGDLVKNARYPSTLWRIEKDEIEKGIQRFLLVAVEVSEVQISLIALYDYRKVKGVTP